MNVTRPVIPVLSPLSALAPGDVFEVPGGAVFLRTDLGSLTPPSAMVVNVATGAISILGGTIVVVHHPGAPLSLPNLSGVRMTGYIDPNADVSATIGWVHTGAGLYFECVNDAIRQPTVPGGSTYLAIGTANGVDETVAFDLATLPNLTAFTSLRVWAYIIGRSPAGDPANVTAVIVDAKPDNIGGIFEAGIVDLNTTLQTGWFSVQIQAADLGSFGTLDQVTLGSLQLQLHVTGNIETFQVHALYIEVAYVGSAAAPAGASSLSIGIGPVGIGAI